MEMGQDFTEQAQQKRILFIPHGEVLAHVGRMLLVAQALREKFGGRIEFAGQGKYQAMIPESGFTFHEVGSRASPDALVLYQKKRSILELRALTRQAYGSFLDDINNELELYRKVKPDLIVWDARFTAPISAEIMGIPRISLMHSYGMPYSAVSLGLLRRNPLFAKYPWLFITRFPDNLQNALWDSLLRAIIHLVVHYANEIRSAYGLKKFKNGAELFATLQPTIIPDVETVTPAKNLPANCYYVGPLAWSPQMEMPEPIRDLKDIIYVTMGSTGSPEVLKLVIETCARVRENPVVVAAGSLIDLRDLKPLPKNIYLYNFLPGVEVIRRASLVICHGGAGTIAHAMSQGVPVIGIPFTMHQEVGINAIASIGAGIKLDLARLTPQKLRQTIDQVLRQDSYRAAASRIAPQFALEEGPHRAADIILKELGLSNPSLAVAASA